MKTDDKRDIPAQPKPVAAPLWQQRYESVDGTGAAVVWVYEWQGKPSFFVWMDRERGPTVSHMTNLLIPKQ